MICSAYFSMYDHAQFTFVCVCLCVCVGLGERDSEKKTNVHMLWWIHTWSSEDNFESWSLLPLRFTDGVGGLLSCTLTRAELLHWTQPFCSVTGRGGEVCI